MSSSFGEMDDSFRVLSLPPTATEAEIKKAYRKLSLRYHPDKAGKDVDPVKAAARFHEINLAYETLMDPAARARAVQRNAEDAAKRERHEQYQGRRRQMADELERNEQQALRKRQEADQAARERIAKIAELQAESRRLIRRKHLLSYLHSSEHLITQSPHTHATQVRGYRAHVPQKGLRPA